MNRRGMLRATGAALGGAGAAVVGLRASADRSTAETALTLDIVGDSATLGADESVEAVWLDVNVEWTYELPESTSPETVVVEIAAGEDGVTVVDSAETPQLFAEADGSEDFETDLLEAGALAASAVDGGGEVDVTVEARLRVEDGDGEALARETATDTAAVSVESGSVDPDEYGSVGGSGELRIEKA